MTTEIVTQSQRPVVQYNQEQVELIKKTIATDATDLELKMFLAQCERTGLDAITRQIYFIKNPKDGKVQIQTSIDGFRLIAERSEKYEGQTKPEWCGEDGKWVDIWLKFDPPSAARVGVYKRGFREALYAVAIFEEYAQRKYDGKLAFMWNKMPSLMISKVAESLALRKAFPNEMSGIYTKEEMAQTEVEASDFEPDSNNARNQMDQPMPAITTKASPIIAHSNTAPSPIIDQKKQLGFIANEERRRLNWEARELNEYMQKKFNKPSNQLSIDDLNELVASLQKERPKS